VTALPDVHRLLVAAGVALLALQVLKFVGVLSAIRWIVAHGGDSISELERRADDLSETQYWDLLDRADGRSVLPLGVMEYRLHRFAARRRPVVRGAVRLGRALMYDFASIGLMVMGYLFLAGTPALRPESHGSVVLLAWASAGLAVLQLIAIYAEACVSYARLGSYGLAWHGASRYARTRRTGTYFAEATTLFGAALYSLGIGALILYFSAGHGARFEALTVAHSTPGGVLSDLLTCLYYSVVTFFTAETPGPQNGLARLATATSVVQAACALILVLTTATLYIKPETRPNPEPDPEPDPVDVPAAPAAPSRSYPFVKGLVVGALLVVTARAARRRRR
jgi:hypothetical protein